MPYLNVVLQKNMKDVIKCPYCGAENVGLEPDEDGDLVCEECGEILDVSFCYIVDFVFLCFKRIGTNSVSSECKV